MLAFNAVYQMEDSGCRIRIIDTDTYVDMCAYISLDGDRSSPVLCFRSEMEIKLENGEMIEIIDPFYEVSIPEKYSEAEYKRCEERYQLITKYWPDQKKKLLKKSDRAEFLKNIAEQENLAVPTIKRLFCRFWQHGMRKSAMFTSYSNSGGKGKKRQPQKKNGPKRSDGFTGLLIDEKVERIFEKAIKKLYETEKKPSLARVYHQMLDEYFSKTINEGGTIKNVMYDEDHLPTERQFFRYVETHLDKAEAYIARMSERDFKLKRRPLSDTATNQIYGPGDCFMIDSTPADVCLVSSINRNKVIGKPTVYITIDVYSRMITGVYVGLENPSWDAVSLALMNMVEDKVKFCKSHNTPINADEWPCHHLPRSILADRGDMISKRAEGIIKELGIFVLNTAPYSGDLKPEVERFFRTMNNNLKETLPGGIHKDHQLRGEKDPRDDAALILEEIQYVIIQTILLHNASIIKDYPSTPQQIADGKVSVPNVLWPYGIDNRTGDLRSDVDREKMALNVWPHDTASLTRKGLRFEDLYYGDIRLARIASGLNETIKMKIIYNPFTVNYVYVLDGNYRKVNLQPCSNAFRDMSFADYYDLREIERANNSVLKRDQKQRRATYEGMLRKVGRTAEKLRDSAPKTTKASRKKDMRKDRENEKAEERRKRTKEPVNETPAKVISIVKPQEKEYMEKMKEKTAFIMDDLFGDDD